MIQMMLFLLACGDKAVDSGEVEDIAATQTDSYSFQGMDFLLQSADGFSLVSERLSLGFSAAGNEMTFSAGCNHYSGSYQLNGDVFVVSDMGGTEMGCEMALMEQDDWLATFFMSNPTLGHDGELLTLTGESATLVFQDEDVVIPDQVLQDMPWEIDTYIEGDAATNYNIEATPNFYFASDGSFTMDTGCNGASGSYTDDGSQLNISIDVITEAICDGVLNTVEGHIFQVMNGNPSYVIDGNRITLNAGSKGLSAVASPE